MKRKMNKNRYYRIALICMLSPCTTACTNTASIEKENVETTKITTEVNIDTSNLFSNRDLSGDYDAAKCANITLSDEGCKTDSKNVLVDGSVITITGEGDYILNGVLSDGQIVVDVDKTEKVQLVLDGVNITSKTSAAIYVKKADKVFVTLADGTENILANGDVFEAVDDNQIDAVIFSKDDLTLNGTGALSIQSPVGHGIVSKDDLVVTSGKYQISASSHGITGKDSVAVADGDFYITAGKTAIKSVNDDDITMGNVYIMGGKYTLSAGTNGINALNTIQVSDGEIVVEQSYEGLEARVINLSGGEITITAQDDGLNATDKRTDTGADLDIDRSRETDAENSAAEKNLRGEHSGMSKSNPEASINISGGVIHIDAEGDGVDSNGTLSVSGGELYVMGPASGQNSALDYDMTAVISGGIVVAAGQSGMAQNFGADSTQGAILVNTQEQNAAGSDIILLDSDGKELIAWTMQKSYNSVVISCPEIQTGKTYAIITGEISTSVTMDGLIYGEDSGFGGGKQGFRKGERPEGMSEPPSFKEGERLEGMPEHPELKERERPEGVQKPSDIKEL